MKNTEPHGKGYGYKGFLSLLDFTFVPADGIRRGRGLLFLSLPLLLLLVTACARRQVSIPPEYTSPPRTQYTAPRAPAGPSAQAEPGQGPLFGKSPEFKKQDLPAGPSVQPPAQQSPPQQTQQPQLSAPAPSRKQEAQSPQLIASMQLVNEARAPLNRGKPDLAIPKLERAIQMDVQNPEAFMLLARAWRQKGAKQKALEFAKKAEILYQDEPARLKEVFQLEADLYKEMGDNANASQYRQKAVKLR